MTFPHPSPRKKTQGEYLAKLWMHTKFSLTQEFADFKISNTFLCKIVHKNKASFMTGVGGKSHNYSYDPENL